MADGGCGEKSLADRVREWRRVLKSGSSAALLASLEIVPVLDDWESYKEETGDAPVGAWCHRHLGRSAEFFRERARAVQVCGREVANLATDRGAIWIANCVPSDRRAELFAAIAKRQRTRPMPLDLDAVVRIWTKIVGPKVRRTAVVDLRDAVVDAARRLLAVPNASEVWAVAPDETGALSAALDAIDQPREGLQEAAEE